MVMDDSSETRRLVLGRLRRDTVTFSPPLNLLRGIADSLHENNKHIRMLIYSYYIHTYYNNSCVHVCVSVCVGVSVCK